jgi:16S rRNA processing protein RimM
MTYEAENYKPIGKILDAHGLKGELKVILFSKTLDWPSSLTEVCINDEVYQVEDLKPNKELWILKLENMNSRTEAETLKGYELLGLKSLFVTHEGEEPFLSELMGFKVLNSLMDPLNPVGEIVDLSETPAHYNLILQTSKGYFEIPYVDDFIESIDRKSRLIKMNFPTDLISDEYKILEYKKTI